MPKGFTVLSNGRKAWFGQDLEDVLLETTAAQAEAIAERLAELTGAKSRERHPINLGLEVH